MYKNKIWLQKKSKKDLIKNLIINLWNKIITWKADALLNFEVQHIKQLIMLITFSDAVQLTAV